MDKKAILHRVYEASFEDPRFIAEVFTSGSYSKKVRTLAPLGTASPEIVDMLCALVDHLRRMIKIVDDLIDEDNVRDHKPAFWIEYGVDATIQQAAYYLARARCRAGSAEAFEQAVLAIAKAVELELSFEAPGFTAGDLQVAWLAIVEKEAAFRRYLAFALGCPEKVIQAMWLDGVAAQILDDSRSALYGKDGRPENSDERLGRLTFMRAFALSSKAAEAAGIALKSLARMIIKRGRGRDV